MQTHELIAHPEHPPSGVVRVAASFDLRDGNWAILRWRIEGTNRVIVPPFAGSMRSEGLWNTTCFELFARSERTQAYSEFNFSPSERWAAYDFSSYRAGMKERAIDRSPTCSWRGGRSGRAIFDVAIARSDLPVFDRYGLSAVIEEQSGKKSYWAIAHPPGKPDFHDPACFAARLDAPTTT